MPKLSTLTCVLLAAALAAAAGADSLTAARPSAPTVRGARVVVGTTVSFRFSAHVGRSALGTGHYRLLAVPTFAGRAGMEALVGFRIVR